MNHSYNHNQNNNNQNQNQHSHHDAKHMWWMMLGCLLPVFVLLFAQGSAPGIRNMLLIIAGIGMFALHFFGMRGHGHQEEKPGNK